MDGFHQALRHQLDHVALPSVNVPASQTRAQDNATAVCFFTAYGSDHPSAHHGVSVIGDLSFAQQQQATLPPDVRDIGYQFSQEGALVC